MKQMDKVLDFMEKLEFQGYACSPLQVETDSLLNDALPEKSWISVRGMPIMRVKEVLRYLKLTEHPMLNAGFIEKNNHVFWKRKQRRKWKDSRTASFREELYLLRYLKKYPEPFVTIDLHVLIESKNLMEKLEDCQFIQGKLLAARLSSLEQSERNKMDIRLPLLLCVKRKEGDKP